MNISRKIVMHKVEALREYEKNPRTHSQEQVAQLAAAICEFGFTNPVLIDDGKRIIAGHGRVMAARALKMAEVPCISLGYLTPQQARLYVIADNKIALNAGWDFGKLNAELEELSADGLDVELSGFTLEEIESLPESNEPGGGEEHPVNAGFVALNFTVPTEARRKILKMLDAIKTRDGVELNGEALVTIFDEWSQFTRQQKKGDAK